MKKVVRSVWICALSGLAFLAACTVQNGLTRKERKQLMKERKQVEMRLSEVKSDEMENPPEDDPNYYRYYWDAADSFNVVSAQMKPHMSRRRGAMASPAFTNVRRSLS